MCVCHGEVYWVSAWMAWSNSDMQLWDGWVERTNSLFSSRVAPGAESEEEEGGWRQGTKNTTVKFCNGSL